MSRLIDSNSFPPIDFGGFESRKLANLTIEGGEIISKSVDTFKLQVSHESMYDIWKAQEIIVRDSQRDLF